MKEHQVSCITKSIPNGGLEHITHIGGVGSAGWRLSKESAIKHIESKQSRFYTLDLVTGKKTYIGVVRETGKAPYLRTHADGVWNNNLLAQSACPLTYAVIA